MKTTKFSATYNGSCYIRGYGRKIYKRGVHLADIRDVQGNIVLADLQTNLSKAFLNCANLRAGSKIEFKAILTEDKRLLYISDVSCKGGAHTT